MRWKSRSRILMYLIYTFIFMVDFIADFFYRWKSWMIKQLCSIHQCPVMRNQDPQVETGALPDSKKEAFHRSTRGELLFFFFFPLCSSFLTARALTDCTLRLRPVEDLLFIHHTQGRQRKQPALLENKDGYLHPSGSVLQERVTRSSEEREEPRLPVYWQDN